MKRARIGLISFGTDPWSLQFCLGAASAARDRDCDLITFRHPAWSGEAHLDGLLLAAQPTSMLMATLRRTIQRGIPVVCVMDGIADLSTVSPDNRVGMEQAVRHLAEHGHRRILYLMGWEMDSEQRQRLKGYQDGLSAAGLEFVPDLVLSNDRLQLESARQLVLDALARELKFTAVLGSTDWAALGAIEALRVSGLRVPEDVAVVGFDNFEIQARRNNPPLASACLPLFEVGYRALVTALEKPVSQGRQVTHEQLPMHLVRRGSCGCEFEPIGRYRAEQRDPIQELAHELFAHPSDLSVEDFRILSQLLSEGLAAGEDLLPLVSRLMRRATSMGLDSIFCQNVPILLQRRLDELRTQAGRDLTPDERLKAAHRLCTNLAGQYPNYPERLRDEFRGVYGELRVQVARLPDEPAIVNCIRRCFQRAGASFFSLYLPNATAPEREIDVWDWQSADGETMRRRKIPREEFDQADVLPADRQRHSALQIGLFGDGFPGFLVVDMDFPYFPWLNDMVHYINISIQSSRSHQALQQRTKELEVTKSLLELAVGDRRKLTMELEEARRQIDSMNGTKIPPAVVERS